MSDPKLEEPPEGPDGLMDIPRHIVLEAMDIARAFPWETKETILSTLETHKRLSSDVRVGIVVARLTRCTKNNEDISQIDRDAENIQAIFPEVPKETLIGKLRTVENNVNKLEVVIRDSFAMENLRLSNTFFEESASRHIPKRKLTYNLTEIIPKKHLKPKLTYNLTEIIPNKHLKSTDSIKPSNSSQHSLNTNNSNNYPKDKISETSVLHNDNTTSCESCTNNKMLISDQDASTHLPRNFNLFADLKLPSTSTSTDVKVALKNEKPTSTTFVEDTLSSDYLDKIEAWNLPSTSKNININVPITKERPRLFFHKLFADWNLPSTSKNTNINVPVTKELPSSTTTTVNVSSPNSIVEVDVKVEDPIKIEDETPTPIPERIEIKDNMKEPVIIDLVNGPQTIKSEAFLLPQLVPMDNTLYYKLMEIFPEADPSHLRRICKNQKYSQAVLNELINDLLSMDYPKRAEQPSEDEAEDQAIDPIVQMETLKQVLPDADPTYLARSLERMNTQDELTMFITRALTKKDYPTYKEYLRKQKVNAQAKQYTTEFNVENFINLIPDPGTYFSQLKIANSCERGSQVYYDILDFLKNHFTNIYTSHIKSVFDKSRNVLTTCAELEVCKEKNLRTRRKVNSTLEDVYDIPLLQLLAYIKHKKLIFHYIESIKKQKEVERLEMKRTGLMITCACCFDDEVIPSDSANCPSGCIFCKSCIAKSVEVAFGEGKLEYACLADCGTRFSVQTLQGALEPKLFSKIAQKKQTEEVKAAGIEDLEFCPFCDFASIPPVGDKLFKCLNPECMKESCRECKESSHVPLRCDEVEKDDDVKKRVFVEDKMTEALLRKCWKCGMKFIKSDGCNKMTCVCGATMCYVCNEPVKDYKHFNGQGGDKFHLCPLYSDTNLLHKESVLKGAEAAKTEIGADGLKIDPTAGIQDYYQDIIRNRPVMLPPGVHPVIQVRDPAEMLQQRMARVPRGGRLNMRRRRYERP